MRDLRDPLEVGKTLWNELQASEGEITPSQAARMLPLYNIPEVSKDDSMGKACVREYRRELESRAEEGDRYAASALESINQGLGVQGYDPSG